MLLDPELGAGQEQTRDLVAPEVVDERAPFLVKPLARVRVLVEMGSGEAGESVPVGGEVTRYPVDENSDVRAVAAIDERLEVRGGSEASGRCEQADRLVSPRSIEGMLADRKQLDVREPHLLDVGNELIGELSIAEEPVPVN